VRQRDRIYDLHLHLSMQKVVGDRLRPADKKDPQGVEDARAMMRTVLDLHEPDMGKRTWAAGETFTMADCAAAPALFYANKVMPFGETHPATAKYFERLQQRPSFARVLKQAEPYFKFFPQ
jgi:glutathione S-transferase